MLLEEAFRERQRIPIKDLSIPVGFGPETIALGRGRRNVLG